MSERKDDLVPNGGSTSDQPAWFKSVESKIPTIQLFPHCKLGDGFAQYAIGSDTGCILVWSIDQETDVDEAALSLEKAKECLAKDEPCSEQTMVFVLQSPKRIDTSQIGQSGLLSRSLQDRVQSARKRKCGQGRRCAVHDWPDVCQGQRRGQR